MSDLPYKLFTTRLTSFLKYSLGHLDFIEIEMADAIVLHEIDKTEELCHIEFPTDDNNLSECQMWNIKAWRNSVVRHEKAKVNAAAQRIEYDNYKWNVDEISEALSEFTGMRVTECIVMAQAMLRKNPEDLSAIGVELKKPYYRGVYVILPCRKQD